MNKNININEDFKYIGSKVFDSKHRISLGSKIVNLFKSTLKFDEFLVFVSSTGDVLLRPAVKIPASEKWLVNDPQKMKLFEKGIEDSAKNRVKKVTDLDEFIDSL